MVLSRYEVRGRVGGREAGGWRLAETDGPC